jgi:hypothetical protein
VLAPHHKAHYEQENYFFDGAEKELSSKRAVLRVRFYNKDEKAVITLKVRPSTEAPPATPPSAQLLNRTEGHSTLNSACCSS